jgi:hypothetical protein
LNQPVVRRRYIVIGAITMCAVGLGYLVWREFPRDSATPATVSEAMRVFRARAQGPLRARPGMPEPGVYRYRTRGGESVDAVVGILSTRHDFGGVTTVAVIPTGCGAVERWQVLTTRWTETASCFDAHGRRLVSVDELHEFFGVRREVVYRCREPPRPIVGRQRPGMSWTGSCTSGDSSRKSVFRVLGVMPVGVGGRRYEAVHTRTRYSMLGGYTGSSGEEEWRRRGDGLLLRRVSWTDAHSGGAPVAADYRERYSLRLISTRPQR